MKPPVLPRWMKLLGGGLLAAGVLAAVGGTGDGTAVEKSGRGGVAGGTRAHGGVRPGAADAGRVELERLSLAVPQADAPIGNAFDATSWYVAPPPLPPPPLPAAPLAPSAPPVPFAYLGSYVAAAAPVLILAKGNRVYTVSPGDVIEGIYRVDAVVENALELTYLPLNVKQQLGTGGA